MHISSEHSNQVGKQEYLLLRYPVYLLLLAQSDRESYVHATNHSDNKLLSLAKSTLGQNMHEVICNPPKLLHTTCTTRAIKFLNFIFELFYHHPSPCQSGAK